ncbi:Uncharacterised protein [Pseudomonas fluorescens]|uniref:Uncharacterized protein n=1 Tax=Pseudomonas fluorescens TaxID=294 RepID=A0A379IKC3_PSEFL|nr:Uncharacterised protein [Pseudomonas fluorescens]
MTLQINLQRLTQMSDQMISIYRTTCFELYRCPLLINLRSTLHVCINTNAEHYMTYISRIPDQLKKDARNLLRSNKNIIRPFQTRAIDTKIAQGLHDRQAHDKTQPLKLSEPSIDTKYKAVVNVLCKWTDPLTPSAPPTCCLLLRENQERCRLPGID